MIEGERELAIERERERGLEVERELEGERGGWGAARAGCHAAGAGREPR